ncbi:MAG TPA: nucleotide pyrophosphatase/phosphodiesterase family protein [Candidatus Dormibacteraeota bacterium]|nr:nucleotide pyrophosphatase/phosphodiesterase family protein [Candidatus Dormibacteraeota bacterium]
MISPPVPVPRYGTRSLAEVVPSILGALGLAGFADRLSLGSADRACLLLVDGLGWEGLKANPAAAPFLNSIAQEPLTTGFPATTAASLTTLATGVPPGEHGITGYTMPIPGFDRAMNALSWSLYGLGPRTELLQELPPEDFQRVPTLAQRAAVAGLESHHLGPAFHEDSGLTRAIGRGERFHAADSLEAVSKIALRLLARPRIFVSGYHPRLDFAGHVQGVASQAWHDELVAVDNGVRGLAEQLPEGTVMVVTGDHGMVELRERERLDLAEYPELAAGVALLSGEARARYVRTFPGATADVLDCWRAVLGDRMWIWTREEAIATGIFGPLVTAAARERIGDIVATAFDRVGIVQRDVDPSQARLHGHHGSLTDAERLVPLLVYRA